MLIVAMSLIVLSTWVTVRFLRYVLATGPSNVPPSLGWVPGRIEHLRGRILFVSYRDGWTA